MKCAFHFLGSFTDLYYLFKLLKKYQGQIKPSENHCRVKSDDIKQLARLILSMVEDLRDDTEEWYGTHRDPTALALLSPHCAAVAESTNPTKKSKCGVNCWSRPCPCSAALFHPRVCQWGLKQKLFCPGCRQQSSCYRLQQLSAVKAAFTLGWMMLGALSASGCPVIRAGHYHFLLLLPA